MITTKINTILSQLAAMNTIFGNRYFFVDPNEEAQNRTINDSLGNHFFASFQDTANGANVTFNPVPYSGCGGYNQSTVLNLYFVLEACYTPEKVFNILSEHIASLNDITINTGGYDAAKIYAALTGQQLPRKITLVYFQITISDETVLGENCGTSICEESCCTQPVPEPVVPVECANFNWIADIIGAGDSLTEIELTGLLLSEEAGFNFPYDLSNSVDRDQFANDFYNYFTEGLGYLSCDCEEGQFNVGYFPVPEDLGGGNYRIKISCWRNEFPDFLNWTMSGGDGVFISEESTIDDNCCQFP